MNTVAEILNKRSDEHLAHAINEAYLMGAYAVKRLSGMTVSDSDLYDSAYRVTQQVILDVPVFIIRRNAELLRAAYIAGYNDTINPEPRSVPSVTIYPVIGLYGDVRHDERISVRTTHSDDGEIVRIVVSFERQTGNNWIADDTTQKSYIFDTLNDDPTNEITYFVTKSITQLYQRHLGYSLPPRYFQQNPGRPE